jgi:hypothetical protein
MITTHLGPKYNFNRRSKVIFGCSRDQLRDYLKKTFLCLIILIFLPVSLAWAQNFGGGVKQIKIDPPERSLKVGECLEYSAEWLGIPVGKIILKVEGVINFSGQQCYHISGRALPNSFFSHLYDVEYEVNSYIETATFLPLRFEKRRLIKNQVNNTTIDFDRVGKKAISSSQGTDLDVVISSSQLQIGQQIPVTDVIMQDTQDLLSSLYYFRLLDIGELKSHQINIYYNQRNWPVKVETEEPFLKEIRKQGTFSVFTASVSSIITDFILGKHKFIICFTADSRRIPLEFDAGTDIGFIRCKLRQIPE